MKQVIKVRSDYKNVTYVTAINGWFVSWVGIQNLVFNVAHIVVGEVTPNGDPISTPTCCKYRLPSMCWKGHCVVQASTNLVNILHSIGGGGVVGWLQILLHMISMVLIIGTLVKSDSTSNEARTSCTKVSVEFMMYLAGSYLVVIIWFN